ncbi:MAG: hypothetical protein AB1757_15225 [Acidobacteriota bacterium]
MKPKLFIVGFVLLSIASISLAGYLYSKRIDTPKEREKYAVEKGEEAFQHYFKSDYQTAKQSIQNHIALLDKLSRESNDPIRNPHAADAAFFCIRLAKLEEKFNGQEKAKYMNEGVERCNRIGKMVCNEEYLRQQVDSMDLIALRNVERKAESPGN